MHWNPRESWARFATVRWRLTLWYTLVLFLSFAIFGAVVDRFVARNLYSQADRQLSGMLAAVTGAVETSYREEGKPTAGFLQEEVNELGLPSEVALELLLPEGPACHFNVRSFSTRLLEAVRWAGSDSGSPTTVFDGSRRWLLRRNAGSGYQVLMARDLSLVDEQMGALRRTLVVVLPLILLFATLSGYFLAGRALKPVALISSQARHIEAHALDQRLASGSSNDEVGQLAQVLNDLFARLERAFQQQRQFLSDAAHELRTPAAILRSQVDVALERPRSADEYAAVLAEMRMEIEHLSATVDDLLLIARAEAAQLPIANEPLDLVEVVDESCRVLRPLAQRKNLQLRWTVGEEVGVLGDARLLRRAVMNVLANAVKYTPDGGTVSVSVKPDATQASVEVTDTGRGVAAEDLPHIFDRFYRGTCSELEGTGLGLAIVKMIVELHGGRIAVTSIAGSGSTFTLSIPAKTA